MCSVTAPLTASSPVTQGRTPLEDGGKKKALGGIPSVLVLHAHFNPNGSQQCHGRALG